MIIEFLADGFEEIEALTPVDILRRAGCDVKCVSVNKTKTVVGAHGIKVEADITAEEAERLALSPEMIILPGGMPGAKNLDESEIVDAFIKKAEKNGSYLAAICAAPMILGKRGILSGKRATCFPGFEDRLEGAQYYDCDVIRDGEIITGRAMGAATEFSLELVDAIKGESAAKEMREKILA